MEAPGGGGPVGAEFHGSFITGLPLLTAPIDLDHVRHIYHSMRWRLMRAA